MKPKDKRVILESVKNQGLAVDVDPPDREPLQGVDWFGVEDGDFVIIPFIKVFHTSRADIEGDRGKGSTGARAVCELSNVGLPRIVLEAAREDVPRGLEFVNVQKDNLADRGVDDVVRSQDVLSRIGRPGRTRTGDQRGGYGRRRHRNPHNVRELDRVDLEGKGARGTEDELALKSEVRDSHETRVSEGRRHVIDAVEAGVETDCSGGPRGPYGQDTRAIRQVIDGVGDPGIHKIYTFYILYGTRKVQSVRVP